MQLKDVMTREVTVVSPEATVQDAARKMEQFNIGPLPVCDGERLVGMLTDRDIIVRAVAQRRDPATTVVHEVMTPEVVYCFEDQDVAEARRLMAERQLRRLPVLNRNKWLVGIVALGDLAVDTGDPQRVGETLKAVSELGAGERGTPRQAREQRGREWDREGDRGRQGYGREERHDWRSPSYTERQQTYPWGQQGQEGYFGEPPRPHAGIPGREGDGPDSGRERQSSGRRERESADSGPHAGRGPRGYQRSDARIQEDICDRLTDHPAIDASEIEVAVTGCEVTLRGTVESRAVKHLAETMAETVPGVRDIHNQLQVTGRQQGSEQTRTAQQENGRTRL